MSPRARTARDHTRPPPPEPGAPRRAPRPGRGKGRSSKGGRPASVVPSDLVLYWSDPIRPEYNLIAKVTANLRAAGQQIAYLYDFNRLREIRYPETTPVTYTYGPPGAPFNRTGRIVQVTDESGSEERAYGKLGETTN
jgi:hypothetical protein